MKDQSVISYNSKNSKRQKSEYLEGDDKGSKSKVKD